MSKPFAICKKEGFFILFDNLSKLGGQGHLGPALALPAVSFLVCFLMFIEYIKFPALVDIAPKSEKNKRQKAHLASCQEII
ncbi:hypothetical protein STRMA_1761 [Streptococcus macacae NCTC 11558]|uniref:Uncharacterized protein n=1 Tax=Streptococcus macacae NCTC 11558 TaxID=764298 RepID=G5JV52_9STRE|nr:hypothetical protein STRMA_1761 [Streptococcus macacae NCTC 11558]